VSVRQNSPWHAQPELALDLDKVCEDAEDGGRRDEHEEHPQVELDGGPVVLVQALDAPLVDDGRVRYRGRHCVIFASGGFVGIVWE
jgi:hypothetical protein